MLGFTVVGFGCLVCTTITFTGYIRKITTVAKIEIVRVKYVLC